MQIHELNNYAGQLGAGSYVAVDNGSDTGKVSTAQILAPTETEIAALDAALNARIDNIIAGGAAPSEAEVTDARLGADGKVYPSLGAAIRTQVEFINNNVKAVFPVSLFLNKGEYAITDIKNVKKSITSTSKWQSDTYCIFNDIPVVEGQIIRIHVDNRSINGDPTSQYGTYIFKDANDATVGSQRYIYYNTGVDNVTGMCDVFYTVPAGAVTLNVTIYGISNYAPTVGDLCYINGACVFVGEPVITDVKRLFEKINLNTEWVRGAYYTGGVFYSNNIWRVATADKVDAPVSFIVDVKSGFRYGVMRYQQDGTYISDTGWLTGKHTIFEGEKITITIAKVSENNMIYADINEFLDALIFYPVADVSSSSQFYYYGERIETKKHPIVISPLGLTRVAPSTPSLTAQGGAIYNGKLVQAYNNDFIQIYDIATDTLEDSLAITCDHGDCVSFSNEFYNAGDDFPLAYFTADTTPAKVYVNRINNGAATLIRTLIFPASAGYYGGHALDADKNILYIIGYSENAYRSDANDNHMIVTAWDLNNLTAVTGGYTPELIKSFTLPFIYCCQDQTFYNGKIFILSSYLASESPSKIVVVDPYKERITNELTQLISGIVNNEDEVITFMEDSNGTAQMVVGNHSSYYQLSFE